LNWQDYERLDHQLAMNIKLKLLNENRSNKPNNLNEQSAKAYPLIKFSKDAF
jgi:hypothetical protein